MTDVPTVTNAGGIISHASARSSQAGVLSPDALSAARELAAEASALRAAIER